MATNEMPVGEHDSHDGRVACRPDTSAILGARTNGARFDRREVDSRSVDLQAVVALRLVSDPMKPFDRNLVEITISFTGGDDETIAI